MKKSLKLVSLILAITIICVLFASCSTMLSGVYSSEAGLGSLAGGKVSYNFKGTKVTVTVTTTLLGSTNSTSYDGGYEITTADDGTQAIVFTFEDEDASTYTGTKSFTQDKDAGTVTIGGVVYTKAK